MAGLGERGGLLGHPGSDVGVRDRLEALPALLVGEYDGGELLAVDYAPVIDHRPGTSNLYLGRLAGLADFTSDDVGIDDRPAMAGKQRRYRRFSRPDAAGKADDLMIFMTCQRLPS